MKRFDCHGYMCPEDCALNCTKEDVLDIHGHIEGIEEKLDAMEECDRIELCDGCFTIQRKKDSEH